MLGVCAALRLLTREGPLRLRTLRVSFPGPLYPDISYTMDGSVDGGNAELRVVSGSTPKVVVQVTFDRTPPHAAGTSAEFTPPAEPLVPGNDALAGATHAGPYGTTTTALADLERALNLGLNRLPHAQCEVLAWVSWCCGMLMPGRQSLIGQVALTFHDGPAIGPLAFDVRTERFDPRFGKVSLAGRLRSDGAPCADAAIQAFARPEPIAVNGDTLLAHVTRSDALRGRIALITGASRGLGASIAGALALQGADVFLNFRSGAAEAEAIQSAITSLGGSAHLVPGDVTDVAAAERVVRDVATAGGLDILVNNASPPILPRTFDELGATGAAEFVATALAAVVLPVRAALPLLRERGGAIVTVSSSWVVAPPARFGHYVAAKGAIEGLMRTLEREEPKLRFITVRPPKLLTDQTNTNFDFEPKIAPARVAAAIAAGLVDRGEGRTLLLDRF